MQKGRHISQFGEPRKIVGRGWALPKDIQACFLPLITCVFFRVWLFCCCSPLCGKYVRRPLWKTHTQTRLQTHTGAAATNNSISRTWATNERRGRPGNARVKGPHSQQLAQALSFLWLGTYTKDCHWCPGGEDNHKIIGIQKITLPIISLVVNLHNKMQL